MIYGGVGCPQNRTCRGAPTAAHVPPLAVVCLAWCVASFTAAVQPSKGSNQEVNIEMERAFQVLADPTAVSGEVTAALRTIRESEGNEKPTSWIGLINDQRLSARRRSLCLFEFFARHVVAGTELSELLDLEGVSGWFSENSVNDVTYASKLPSAIDRDRDGSVFMLQPDFVASENGAVYLQVSQRLTRDEFLRRARRGTGGSALTITAVAPTWPDLDP